MATRLFSRSMLINKQTLVSVLSRSYSSLSSSTRPSSLSSLSTSYLLRFRSLAAFSADFRRLTPVATSVRGFATRQTSSSLNDPNPNWSNRPPKETILLDGCDFEHWLIVMEKPEGEPTRDEIIDSYIKTLAMVVGSEEEARMKIYSVSTRHYFAFGALISEELSYKVKELPRVRWVLPDSYLDVKNKDYGGEPFINGQAVPYDPKYHEEWVRNNARANERNRRNDRPRNYDRSRNFERRRTNMQNQNVPNPGANVGVGTNVGPPATNMGHMPPNMGGGSPNSMGGVPPNMGGVPPNSMGGAPPNMGGVPPNSMGGAPPNMGGVPPNSMGGALPRNMGGTLPSNMGGAPPNMGGVPPNKMGGVPSGPQNWGGAQNSPQNWGGRQPNSMGGVPPDMGGYRSGPVPGPNPQYQQSYAPNSAGGNSYSPYSTGGNSYAPNSAGGNTYASQEMPGRDLPPPPNYQ